MRRLAQLAAMLCAGISLGASDCWVRLVYAVPARGGAWLVARQGEWAVDPGRSLPSPSASAYLPFPSGEASCELQVEGELLLSAPFALPRPGRWTVIVAQRLGDRPLSVLEDDPPEVDEAAGLRLAAVVPDVDRVRAEWQPADGRRDAISLGAVELGAAGGYVVCPVGPGRLSVWADDEPEPFYERDDLRLLPGFVVTLVLAGLRTPEDEGDLPVCLLPLLDRVPPGATP